MIVTIDPGGVTGIATYRAGHVEPLEVPGGFDGFHDWAHSENGISWATTDVVIEKFTINAGTHRKDPVAIYETLDIIGGVRYMCRSREIGFRTQTPSQAKNFATDEVLKALGWHFPSTGGHQNDAVRHLVRFLASRRDRHVIETIARMDG
jgi:hypothetical protein